MAQLIELPEKLKTASAIEEILCLATLISVGKLSPDSNLSDSSRYFTEECKNDCSYCPYWQKCLAMIVNE